MSPIIVIDYVTTAEKIDRDSSDVVLSYRYNGDEKIILDFPQKTVKLNTNTSTFRILNKK